MRVSVLITNHNNERFVGQAIESALKQTSPACDVVVVDDGSTDDSRDVIEGYRAEGIRICYKTQGGQYSAQNRGLALCGGDAVALLDSDDYFDSTKLEVVAATFAQHPQIASVFHPRIVVDPNGERRPPLAQRGVRRFGGAARLGFMPSIATTTSGMTLRRAALESISPLPEDPRLPADDHILKWATLGVGPAAFIDEFLSTQLIHSANHSTPWSDPVVGAKQAMVRAFLARERYRPLRVWADRSFAAGWRNWRAADGSDDLSIATISEYLRALSPPRRALVKAAADPRRFSRP